MTHANNITDRGEVALVMELVLLRMTKLILNLRFALKIYLLFPNYFAH